jgi:hypothetical protein
MNEKHSNPTNIDFDVALSFAGEDRGVAEDLANSLTAKGIKTFYDEFFKADLWGKDLYAYLAEIYGKRAQYCVILVSEHYIEKKWTAHERKNAQARAFAQDSEYILPIRIDKSELPGFPDTIGYLSIEENEISDIADLIVQKIHGESESSLQRLAEIVEAKFWEKRLNGMRFNCSVCGSGPWGGVDNIHYCLHCQAVYCISCVNDLTKVSAAVKYKWKCKCGGRVY